MKNEFDYRGIVTAIYLDYLGKRYETLIDTLDYRLADSYQGRWAIVKSVNRKNEKYYVYGALKKQNRMSLHRLLMNFPEGLDVDHINDNSLDNRRSVNLQAITRSENVKKQDKNIKDKNKEELICE